MNKNEKKMKVANELFIYEIIEFIENNAKANVL